MTMDTDPMIIGVQLPEYDVGLAVHTVIDADPATTFCCSAAIGLPDSANAAAGHCYVSAWPTRPAAAPPPPAKLTLADGAGLPGWLSLGVRDEEVAFGAVGKFWQANIKWRDVPAAEFHDFHEPGWGKIACNFIVRAYGTDRTLLTYECRTATIDAAAQREFARYWWLIRQFVAHIMRATLATIAVNARRSPRQHPAAP